MSFSLDWLTMALSGTTNQTAVPAGTSTQPKKARRERVARAGEKRVVFASTWLGIAFIVPQLLLIFTFFYWPAGQAIFWAFTLQQPWGGGNEWVGLQNIIAIVTDPIYWNSVAPSATPGCALMAFQLAV